MPNGETQPEKAQKPAEAEPSAEGGNGVESAPPEEAAGEPAAGEPDAAAEDVDAKAAAAKKAKAVAAAKAAAAKKAAGPPRELPSEDDLARWIAGVDLPSLSNLFNLLNTKQFDIQLMLIKKEELLPQHWQVISALEPPADEEFERLAEVERLSHRLTDPAVRKRRLECLKIAWQELRGKRPSLWTVSDLFAAMRRIIDRKRKVDHHDLLSAVRDVWRDLTIPHGREQLEVLWACLDLVRSKTKK